MSGAYHVGAVALRTQQLALDALANNIANINTGGFKRADVRFADVVAGGADGGVPSADLASAAPTLAGVALDVQFMLNEGGALQRTGAAMDVAIDGGGLIELIGADGRTLLWRGGRLQLGPEGQLTGPGGLALKAAITVPADAGAIAIAADGTVSAETGGETSVLGQIQLVRVTDAGGVERLDGGLYRVADETTLAAFVPGEDGTGRLVQGALEGSNVQLTDEMVRMMLVQRAYAANAQVLQAADQLLGIANGLRR
ncbi:flagellar hook-basal body protein [Sphingomonas sp. VNH70]|uniref:flagellar hook-basal body protein n=1 Tax=Sphingomonas silueang TaxID=3156617 RepID=UPI0032B442C2